MGYYINATPYGPLPINGKADAILATMPDAREVKGDKFEPNLVVVVENGFFDAVGYAFNSKEYHEFRDPRDQRAKRWLIVPDAAVLSGYERHLSRKEY